MRRPRLLVLALTLALTATLTGWHAGSADAASAAETMTTIVDVSPDHPGPGDTITVTASVVAPQLAQQGGSVPGQVVFWAAPDSSSLWEDGESFGPVPLSQGTASVQIELTEAELPFLATDADDVHVAARYQPFDGQTSYEDEYVDSQSPSVRVVLGDQDPTATETVVTGPETAVAGVGTSLQAAVHPAGAVGSVQFSVDGAPVGTPVPVSAGSASVSHTFEHGGEHTVTAAFEPSDPTEFTSSADTAGLVVGVDPAATTTEVTAPASATVGTPVTLAATVSPASAGGTMTFSVDGVAVGEPVPVEGGAAALEHTFTSGGVSTVRATFTPADDATYAGSTDSADVTVGKAATTVAVAGPDRVVAGAAASLTATVTPAGAAGRVSFLVDDRIVGTARVTDGTAVLSYRFVSLSRSRLSAVWKPDDAASYETATAPVQLVHVVAGSSGAEFGTFLSASFASLTLSAPCADARGGGPGTARDEPTVFSILITVLGALFDLLRALFETLSLHFTAVLCGPGGRGEPAHARVVQGTVDCQLAESGLECPFDLPAVSEITISGSLPVPADLAGQTVRLGSTLSTVDPETGELTPVDSAQGTVRVPHRTVLSARLAPRPRHVTSVGHGRFVAYGITVRNAGVVTADHVRACVSVGRGARITLADNGGRIHGRTACWTLPAQRKGAAVNRTIHLRAPRAKGDLRLTAVVRPRRTQADRLRLAAVLPVR